MDESPKAGEPGEEQQQVVESAGYPFFGYEYDHAGYHSGPVELTSEQQLVRFRDLVATPAIRDKREVMLTDSDDYAVFHAKDGVILWAGGPV